MTVRTMVDWIVANVSHRVVVMLPVVLFVAFVLLTLLAPDVSASCNGRCAPVH